MTEDCIIIGTDYGVGKTLVTCSLLRELRRRGFNAMGYKPVCCGNRAEARAMREATEPAISLDLINPLYLRANADPYIAAQLQRVTVDSQLLLEGYRSLKDAGYAPIVIEGVGAWDTPIAADYTMADLTAQLGLPVLLVADNRLGTAALVSMIAKEMKTRGVDCRGIILNQKSEEWDTAAVTNRQLIEDITGLPVVAEVIYGQDDVEILGGE